jgi:hypothetical protein
MTTNTLTNLIPDLHVGLDIVSRELVGMVPSVTLNAEIARAKKGQSVFSSVTPVNESYDITPSMDDPAEADQNIGNVEITISKSKASKFSWDGEEARGLNTGQGHSSVVANQFAQAVRVLVNEMETDLANLHSKTSRAYGTAGTTPFGTAGDYTDASEALRILKDNGAPLSDNHIVMNTAAGARFLGKQADSNRQGTDSILRQGVLLDVSGMALRESAQIQTPAAGTASSATTNDAGYAKGATDITLASAGTGAIITGDVVTFAGDANKYLVVSGDADVSNGGTITIAAPGLQVALTTDATAVTVVAAAARNMVFNRGAIVLATRMPERPAQGDKAIDVTSITDPRSGLTFEVSMYPGYRKMVYEVSAAWGMELIKPEHSAILLG